MNSSLDKLRKEIDEIDDQLLGLLAGRLDIVRKIGLYKKQNGLKTFDEKRWRDVLESKLSKGDSLGLSREFIKKLYSIIHEFSLKEENDSR